MRAPTHQLVLRAGAAILLAFAFAGSVLDGISSSLQLISPTITYRASPVLAMLWIACVVLARSGRVPWAMGGNKARINRLSWNTHAAFLALALILWIPRGFDWLSAPQSKAEPVDTTGLSIPFAIYNGWPNEIPVWVMKECDLEVLQSVTSAQDHLLARGRARLEMPTATHLNGRPLVDFKDVAQGRVLVPRAFGLRNYFDRGYTLRIGIHVGPANKLLMDEHVLDEALLSSGFEYAYRPE